MKPLTLPAAILAVSAAILASTLQRSTNWAEPVMVSTHSVTSSSTAARTLAGITCISFSRVLILAGKSLPAPGHDANIVAIRSAPVNAKKLLGSSSNGGMAKSGGTPPSTLILPLASRLHFQSTFRPCSSPR